jgi:hypothetical protein
MFQIAMESRVGNGNITLFWRDNWLTGKSISEIAPLVVEAVPAKIKNKRTVAEAMADQTWTRDVRGGLSLLGQFEFFLLVDALLQVVLTQEEDVHVWRLDALGQYTSKSTYRAFFNGSITFETGCRAHSSTFTFALFIIHYTIQIIDYQTAHNNVFFLLNALLV